MLFLGQFWVLTIIFITILGGSELGNIVQKDKRKVDEQDLPGERKHLQRDIQRQKHIPGLWQTWKKADFWVMSLKITEIFQVEKETQSDKMK